MSLICAKYDVALLAPNAPSGTPVHERMSALAQALASYGLSSCQLKSPSGFVETLALVRYLYGSTKKTLVITMPPFRGWFLLLLPGVRTILDWRDGWSVAMRSGYGNTVPAASAKARMARIVEILAMLLASKTIVCTPGLFAYHARGLPRFLKKTLLLVPNGHQLDVVDVEFKAAPDKRSAGRLLAVCAGKFSEYGAEKAERVVETLLNRYPSREIEFRMIGADMGKNGWLLKRFDNQPRLNIRILPRMEYGRVIDELRGADLAVVTIRDEEYDLGTKIFDYIACGKPVLDVFDRNSAFREYFAFCFDTDYCPDRAMAKARAYERLSQMRTAEFLDAFQQNL